jgi:hypothetical protein
LVVPFPQHAPDVSTIEKSLPELQRRISKKYPGTTIEICYTRRNPFDVSHAAYIVASGIAAYVLNPMGEKLRKQIGDYLSEWMKQKLKGLTRKKRRPVSTRR